MGFEHRYVMITGAGGGIGRDVAQAYAACGARVILIDKNAEVLERIAEVIRKTGQEPLCRVVDLSDPAAITSCFDWLRENSGRLDVLINNAGFGIWKSVYDLTVDEWDDVVNTNLRGTFLCSREAAKLMREGGGGAIVNIASTRALMSETGSEAYAASKGGILSLTHALALSLGRDGITRECH